MHLDRYKYIIKFYVGKKYLYKFTTKNYILNIYLYDI